MRSARQSAAGDVVMPPNTAIWSERGVSSTAIRNGSGGQLESLWALHYILGKTPLSK